MSKIKKLTLGYKLVFKIYIMENQNKKNIGQSIISLIMSIVVACSFLGYWAISFVSTDQNYFSIGETVRTYLSIYPLFAILGIIIGFYLESNNENKKPGNILVKISIGVFICTILIYLGLFLFPSDQNSWK